METIAAKAALREKLAPVRRSGGRIGLVPTMGYLHHGHLALMRRARADSDLVVASIFVNPLQFGPAEDFERYPRDLDRDAAMLAEAGVDMLFAPSVAEMYPQPMEARVELPRLGGMHEGAARPGHFAGVATVVTKLFNIVEPTRAYFGEKDYQQLHLIRRMVADLDMPLEVVGVPTVREADGLAASSRNVYLAPAERAAATVLNRALATAERLVADGERDPARVEAAVRDVLASEPLAATDIVSLCDADTLEPAGGTMPDRLLIMLYVAIGRTRLLDERVIRVGEEGKGRP